MRFHLALAAGIFAATMSAAIAQDSLQLRIQDAGGPVQIPGGGIGPIVCALIPLCYEDGNSDDVKRLRAEMTRRALSAYFADGQSLDNLLSSMGATSNCMMQGDCAANLKDWSTVTLGLAVDIEPQYLNQPIVPIQLDNLIPQDRGPYRCLMDSTCKNAANALVLSLVQ
jgi:hypothetical protein